MFTLSPCLCDHCHLHGLHMYVHELAILWLVHEIHVQKAEHVSMFMQYKPDYFHPFAWQPSLPNVRVLGEVHVFMEIAEYISFFLVSEMRL